MKQFSLAFLICLTALIAVTISHGIATWQLTAAQREIEWLKSARIKAWPEPDLLSVVSLNAPSSSLDVDRRKVHWHWKIMTPPDKPLRICWRTSSKTLSDAPTGTANGNESSIELPAGRTIELQTMIHETEDGKLHLSCNIGGKQREFTIQSDLKLFEQRGYVHNIAGVRETIAGDPKTPFLLACLRGYANPSVPSDGFKLWVEPSLD